jgi:hypothetical protein
VNVPNFIQAASTWLVEAASSALELVSLVLTHRHRRDATRLHVQRLSAEIIEVVESMEVDLADLPERSDITTLARQADRCRQQAQVAGRAGSAAPIAVLQEAAAQLHEGHRRIVNLRSELDALLAARREGKEVPRACRFATGSKPVRSRWASTSSHTRSTTLD